MNETEVNWYLVFCDPDTPSWWDRVLRIKEGFGHVYAIRWTGEHWLYYNPGAAYTDVAIINIPEQNGLDALIHYNGTVVHVESHRQGDVIRGRWWAGPMTCVEQIKALLGIPVASIWTPHQLYKYLLRFDHGTFQEAEDTRTDRGRSGSQETGTIRVRRRNPKNKRAAKA